MGTNYSPKQVIDGLVLCLDAANIKSYPGTGSTWFDLNKNVRDVTLNNSPSFNSIDKKCFVFDGVNDFGTSPFYSAISKTSTPHTMMAWINYVTNNAIYGIVNIGQWADTQYATGIVLINNVFHWSYNGAGPQFMAGNTVSSDYTLASNTWYHLAFSRTASNVSFFVNGQLIITKSSSMNASIFSSPIMIGVGSQNGARSGYFNGKIAQASVFNRALSSLEVRQNFNALRGRYGI